MNKQVISTDTTYYNKLLVEGIEDVLFLQSLFKYYNIKTYEQPRPLEIDPSKIALFSQGGIQQLLTNIKNIETLLDESHPTRLGLIIDADDYPDRRWQALRDILYKQGYTDIPKLPNPQGTIIQAEENRPAIGLWLMPDNQVPGMLEHFCSFLVPKGDTLWPVAEKALQTAITYDHRFPRPQLIKAHLHTWLAWQEEPGQPLGKALMKKFFNPQAPTAQIFINWIYQFYHLKQTSTKSPLT